MLRAASTPEADAWTQAPADLGPIPHRNKDGGSPSPGPAPAAEADTRAPLEVRRSWARLLPKVYEVDPLICPRCGGAMKVIAVIEQPAVIRRILDHLGLTAPPTCFRPPPAECRALAVRETPEWTYEPVEDALPPPDPLTI